MESIENQNTNQSFNNNDSEFQDLELQKKAIANMIEGINIAQKKGAYSLEESATLFEAISLFLKKEEIN